MRALLRRAGDDDEQGRCSRFEDLRSTGSPTRRWRGERTLELTRTEFLLLELFLRHPRQVLTRSVDLRARLGL